MTGIFVVILSQDLYFHLTGEDLLTVDEGMFLLPSYRRRHGEGGLAGLLPAGHKSRGFWHGRYCNKLEGSTTILICI